MPSIRIRNSRYLNIRDVFDDEGNPATPIQSPEAPTPFLRSAQSTPQFRDRPTSSPLQQPSNLNDTPLVSPILSPRLSENNRSSRRRSNSRVSAHVLSTYSTLGRSNQWSTEGHGSSSTDALNPLGTPTVSDSPLTPHIVVRRPSTLTVEGSQANVTIQAEGGTPGILERRFPEHAHAGKFSPRPDQDDDEDHHHDDIVEHLDVIGAFCSSSDPRSIAYQRGYARPTSGNLLKFNERCKFYCPVGREATDLPLSCSNLGTLSSASPS